jgi:HK97 family phage major capsid protein/HK97 family phage prohead protease
MKIKTLFRASTLERAETDSENRTVKLSFSSEIPVERYFGNEILSHAPGAADLSRLNNGAPLLFNHDPDRLIGVVESARIADGRGVAVVRFSRNPDGERAFQDVQDGILRNVSVGYRIEQMQLTGERDGIKTYTVTRWTPHEISAVSVPADPTTQIGRNEDSGEEYAVEVIATETNEEQVEMEPETKIETVATPVVDVEQIGAEAVKAERARVAQIEAIAKKHGLEDLGRQLIEGGKSLDESRAAFLERIQETQGAKIVKTETANIGLSEKEIRQFSFMRLINALANPGDRRAQEAAKYEREISEAAAAKTGRAPQGFLVPTDVLNAKRDLVAGTASAGGYTVSTDLLAESFIELLRKKSIVQAAGARVMSGLVGNVSIPKHTGAASAFWLSEGQSATESQQTFDQVTMSPKTVGAYTDISRKLMLQSSLDVEALVRADLAAVLALAIDQAALYGTGASNQPMGLKGLLAGSAQELDFAGATPTFAEIVGLESKISSKDADVAGMRYIVNANMAGALKSAAKEAGYPVYILEGGTANGYPVLTSNQVAAGDVIFGDFAGSMMLGFWSGLDIMVDPFSGSTSGTVRIVAMQDCDIAIRHAESFARGNNTL